MIPNHPNRAIVIGAGLSGLAAAHALRQRDIPVTILEAASQVAAPWRARHPQLRLNIHRHYAQLPGSPMTLDDRTFVGRDAVINYLNDYAQKLDAEIEFNTPVVEVMQTANGWRVRTNRQDYDCAHLIVATGRDSIPVVPVWPGMENFSGEIVHAANFGDVRQYDGRKVLVIGAGNSGTDMLNHLARANPARVWVSVRHGPSILPTRILGFPLQRLASFFNCLPKWSLDPSFVAMQWLAFGDLRKYGLKRHPLGGNTRMRLQGVTFALDDGFVAALKAGRVEAVAETVSFDKERVGLKDGRRIEPDIVLCATGYRSGLEPLFGRLDVLDAAGRPRCPMGQADSDNPGLWFTGFTPGFTGYFHAAGVTAKRIAEHIVKSSPPASDLGRLRRKRNLNLLRSLSDQQLQDIGLRRMDLTRDGLASAAARHNRQADWIVSSGMPQ